MAALDALLPVWAVRWRWGLVQQSLRRKLLERDDFDWAFPGEESAGATEARRPLRLVAGVDISFFVGPDALEDTRACVALVVCELDAAAGTAEVVWEDYAYVDMTEPYVAGYLAFREVPHHGALLRRLRRERPDLAPDVVLVDGNGVLHPRAEGQWRPVAAEASRRGVGALPMTGLAVRAVAAVGLWLGLTPGSSEGWLFQARSEWDELDLRPLERRLLNKRAFGVRPTIVHVGPNNLMQPDEVARYTEWLKFFPHVLLVEPNPSVARGLLERLSAWGAARASLMEVVQAALCVGNTQSASFYRFSENVLKEFPNLDPYHISEGGSLLQDKYNTTWSENFGGFKNPGYSQEEWERMLTYVEEIKVKCFTAERLLERNAVRPSDVDILIVDAEGLDDQIVMAFFALEGFRPAFVMYEKSIVWRMKGVEKGFGALAEVVGMLVQRGYSWYGGGDVDSYAVARAFT
ncbi:unnamed protein product [Prorocentrum cordatum]|uniref:Endonuclease V n=1 Tax=Prorocentrum cordatum TaxID=2364126 RepID=A0ABN9VG59_9DINO|nr:unnamed protein product [Polarella glacialis]